MRKLLGLSVLAAGLAAAISCSVPAHADSPAGPPGSRIAIAIAPAKLRAPYDVQVMRASGETLPTYGHRDRFYVEGDEGERYVIRVTNPTSRRIEAVVTVDGLDVIDGEGGDLRKRGYVVPAYGETRIEGFRTSSQGVATFRFSSVDGSYAGMKGKARNVGVIAVAIFEEHREPEQEIILEGGGADFDDEVGASVSKSEGRRDSRPAKSRRAPPADAVGPAAEPPPPPSPAPPHAATGGSVRAPQPDHDRDDAAESSAAQRTHRPGLGTEFGEHRYSATNFTRFVRAAGRPVAIAELRYNDADGLIALGIRPQPRPDAGELMTRETAEPFPGDGRYARPPGR